MTNYSNNTMFVQWIKAPNDSNGNPRRAFVIYAIHEDDYSGYTVIVDVIDDGYQGQPQWVRKLPHADSVKVSVAEYKRYLKYSAVTASEPFVP